MFTAHTGRRRIGTDCRLGGTETEGHAIVEPTSRKPQPGRHRARRQRREIGGPTRRATMLGALAVPPTIAGLAAAGRAAAAGVVTGPNVHAQFRTLSAENATAEDAGAVQSLLRARGYTVPWAEHYDARVSDLVARYQSEHGLTASGRFDGATLRSIQGPARTGGDGWLTRAAQLLLVKHGYRAPGSLTAHNAQTRLNVMAFQSGHIIARQDHVDQQTWFELFAPPNSGPLYPMQQRSTGGAQWSNCGPTSAVAVLLNLGVSPSGWNGLTYTADRRRTVEEFRYRAMGVPNTAERDARGTEFPQFQRGFGQYGLAVRQGSVADVIAAAKAGRPSVCGGDANRFTWANYVSGPVSHWVAVLGWNGSSFLVMDPIVQDSANAVHKVSEAVLRDYGSVNPGYYEGHPTMAPASKNNILLVP